MSGQGSDLIRDREIVNLVPHGVVGDPFRKKILHDGGQVHTFPRSVDRRLFEQHPVYMQCILRRHTPILFREAKL